MDLLKLDAQARAEMLTLYLEERSKLTKRIAHLNEVLAQLDPQEQALPAKKRKTRPKSSPKTSAGKRGPKPVWEARVIKTLEQAKRPLGYDELVDHLITSGTAPAKERSKVKAAVQNIVFRLRKESKVFTLAGEGRTKVIALNAWVGKDGKLKLPANSK